MEDLFKNVTHILKAEEILEGYFNPTDEKNNILTNVPLSENDFNYLNDELYKLINDHTPVTYMEDLPLSILVSWAYALKNNSVRPGFLTIFHNSSRTMLQHHYRFYISLLSNAIVEFSIENFGINHSNFDGLYALMKKHAEYKTDAK